MSHRILDKENYLVILRTFQSLALALCLALISPFLTNATQVNAALKFDPRQQFRVIINESEWFNYPSYLALRKQNSANSQDYESFLCPKWGVGECILQEAVSNYQYFGTVVLPFCSASDTAFCIESLELKFADGNWQQAKFNRHIKGPTQEPIPEIGYPGGGTISLFEPRDEDRIFKVDGYAVYASVEIIPTAIIQREPKFVGLDLRITPFNREDGKFSEQTITTSLNESGQRRLGFSSFPEKIVWSESNQRGKVINFPKDVAARISLRVPNTVTGWVGGRLNKAEIGVSKLNARTNRLVIGGFPATVGLAEVVLERTNPPEFWKKDLEARPSVGGFGYRGSNGVFDVLDSIRDSLNDRSVSEETRWSLNSYANSTSQCLKDDASLVGLVSTNATVFDGVPPLFDGKVLTYKVGGLHYDSKGGITAGNYDLVMRSDVARCLYKFTNAPIQASISVVSELGDKRVATTFVNESDGWLYLGAYNFTFSSPTIQIRLSQESPKSSVTSTETSTGVITSSPSPILESNGRKKPTINCVKGKLTKKVTAVKPKCPKGYKKKSKKRA